MPWPFKSRATRIEEAHALALTGDRNMLPVSYRVPSASMDSTGNPRPNATPWQSEAWDLWDDVGELHSPTSYIARIISRLVQWSVNDADAEESLEALETMYGPGTNVEELIRLIVLNLQVAGDMWLMERTTKGAPDYGWTVLSVVTPELARVVEDARRAGREVRRVYTPHPVRLTEGDSAFRNVREPARILLAYDRLTRAQTRSRIAQAGILRVPAGVQASGGGDPFGAGLEQAMTAAIKDPDSPAAMVPIKVEVDPSLPGDAIKHYTFDRPFDDKIPAKVEQAINRIALGLDVPPELIYGLGDMNHWTAWAAQDETWRGTLAPLADIVAGIHEDVWEIVYGERETITPDPTDLLARRSSVRDALDGAEIGAVGLKFVRDAMGATDDDAATEEDLRIMAAARASRPATVATVEETRDAPSGGDPTEPEEGATP